VMKTPTNPARSISVMCALTDPGNGTSPSMFDEKRLLARRLPGRRSHGGGVQQTHSVCQRGCARSKCQDRSNDQCEHARPENGDRAVPSLHRIFSPTTTSQLCSHRAAMWMKEDGGKRLLADGTYRPNCLDPSLRVRLPYSTPAVSRTLGATCFQAFWMSFNAPRSNLALLAHSRIDNAHGMTVDMLDPLQAADTVAVLRPGDS
jgi:hypothetical protein